MAVIEPTPQNSHRHPQKAHTIDDGGSPYAIPSEVARYGRTTVQRLAQDRYLQRGIPFIKDGRKVLYRWDDVRNHYDKLAKESA